MLGRILNKVNDESFTETINQSISELKDKIEAEKKRIREAEDRKAYEAHIKKQAEEAAKKEIEREEQRRIDAEKGAAERAAEAEFRKPDKAKMLSFIEFLENIEFPELKTADAKAILNYSIVRLDDIIVGLKGEVNDL